MKTTIAVFFGGRSTEHEISVISANQAINAIDRDKYNVVPIYISKEGAWYTGDCLLDLQRYRNLSQLLKESEAVYMRPIYGDYNLYYSQPKGLFGKKNVAAKIDVEPTARTAHSKEFSTQSASHTQAATHSPRPTAWTKSR